jgi:1-acyl-sn-glycerol-3-phosphate acyltransferase
MGRLKSLWDALVSSISELLIMAPWALAAFILRLLYGYQIEGTENIPPEGPFIVLTGEYTGLGMLATNWLNTLIARKATHRGESTMFYMQEFLWSMPYFHEMAAKTTLAPLVPHAAGRLSLNLLDGLRALRNDGIVIMNPEGDVSWDGRPAPVRLGAAWLSLHTAAPLVPALCSTGEYDVWPRWQAWPSVRGRFVVTVGQPFRLCDTPQEQVTNEDVAQATARIQAEFDRMRYGPGGPGEWAGPPLRDGVPVEQPIQLRPASEPVVASQVASNTQSPLRKRGVTLLLWRCPVCHNNDALIHEHPRFRPQSVSCQACGTRWEMRRVVGKDFRLKVVEGPPDLVGLDMALLTWYDEMKRGFQPSPISVSGVDLLPREEVYLQASDAALLPHRPNALLDGWTGREPPQAQPPGQPPLADWPSVGEGRLLLTSHRLLWQGPPGELDFMWSSVRAVSLWLINTLGINYGTAPYQFKLGQEVGLKWLTYAGTLARQVAERDGHVVTVTPF